MGSKGGGAGVIEQPAVNKQDGQVGLPKEGDWVMGDVFVLVKFTEVACLFWDGVTCSRKRHFE